MSTVWVATSGLITHVFWDEKSAKLFCDTQADPSVWSYGQHEVTYYGQFGKEV